MLNIADILLPDILHMLNRLSNQALGGVVINDCTGSGISECAHTAKEQAQPLIDSCVEHNLGCDLQRARIEASSSGGDGRANRGGGVQGSHVGWRPSMSRNRLSFKGAKLSVKGIPFF